MAAQNSPRWRVRDSGIHGKGAFALKAIAPGEWIGTYAGTRIPADSPDLDTFEDKGHTFLFALSDGSCIDGARGGNGTRFINHSCSPNAEAYEESGVVRIYASKPILPGDEILYDYRLQVSGQGSARRHACLCGSVDCRGTMVASRRLKKR